MVVLMVTAGDAMTKVEYDPPNYDIIRKAVGGLCEYVQPEMLNSSYCMMVNEAGYLCGLPENFLASLFYHGQPILGDVLFLKHGFYGGEPDVVGMTEVEAQVLGDLLSLLTCGVVHWAPEMVEV